MEPLDAERILRGICAPHARRFGSRLLSVARGGSVAFPQFVEVAREFVEALPDQAATWLAALVALDMRREQGPKPPLSMN
ncbi:MAG: hypothetical protein Fur0037_28780 [Planctomycetota bacterium]